MYISTLSIYQIYDFKARMFYCPNLKAMKDKLIIGRVVRGQPNPANAVHSGNECLFEWMFVYSGAVKVSLNTAEPKCPETQT